MVKNSNSGGSNYYNIGYNTSIRLLSLECHVWERHTSTQTALGILLSLCSPTQWTCSACIQFFHQFPWPCLMLEGDRYSENAKKFPRLYVKACMICSVKWVPQSPEIVKVRPKLGSKFPKSFFATVKASALQQGEASIHLESTRQQQEHIASPH